MRLSSALIPVFSAAVLLAPANAAVLGGPVLQGGVEIIPSAVAGMELDKGTKVQTPDSIFLAADIHAGANEAHGFAEHAFIPYLSVSFVLTKEGMPTYRKVGLLFPVATKTGPRYGAYTELAGAGSYHLSYIVSPPSAHGMMRQAGKDGVTDWWKPITGSWIFTYPMSTK